MKNTIFQAHRYQERLRKVYFVLENILGSPVDGQGMTYSLKSQAHSNAPVHTLLCVSGFVGHVGVIFEISEHLDENVNYNIV